jgi:hypothetical protein
VCERRRATSARFAFAIATGRRKFAQFDRSIFDPELSVCTLAPPHCWC